MKNHRFAVGAAWAAWGASALVGGAVRAQEPASFGDPVEFAPPYAAAYVTAAPTPAPQDFQDLIRRLESAEKRLEAIDHFPGGTAEKRLEAVEKAVKPKPATFPSTRLAGFFQADAGHFIQDAGNRAALGDIQDGAGFRRARLQAIGSVAEFTNYSLQLDFGIAGRPSFTDVFGEQTHLPVVGAVRIGHFKQPFGVEALTSVRNLQFLERSMAFQAFVPFRRTGIMGYDKSEDDLTTWQYSVYRTGGVGGAPVGDSRFATDIGDNGGVSVAGRATHLLSYDVPAEGRYLWHVGAACTFGEITATSGTNGFYQARAIPEFFVGDPAGGSGGVGSTAAGTPFVADTGRIPAKSFTLWGLETVAIHGAFNFQAEWMMTTVDQIGGPTLFYDGGYAQAGYFLTGENRAYNKTFGALDKLVPFTDFFGLGRRECVAGWGAWEVAGRLGYLNLDDPGANAFSPPGYVGPPAGVNPGRVVETTLGLNWYWNPYSKVQFNYIHGWLDNRANGNSDLDILCARYQIEF